MNPLALASLISAAIAGAAGFGLAWRLQTATITQIELERANERIEQQRATRAALERATSATIAAQNAATSRGVALRRSSESAASELNSLRASTDAAVRAAQTDAATCSERASTLAGLLNQCGQEYQELGAKADRHVSDIKTLTESWPQ